MSTIRLTHNPLLPTIRVRPVIINWEMKSFSNSGQCYKKKFCVEILKILISPLTERTIIWLFESSSQQFKSIFLLENCFAF